MTARKRPSDTAALEDLSSQAWRLLEAVEHGDVVADDAVGRRVVEARRLLADGSPESTKRAPTT